MMAEGERTFVDIFFQGSSTNNPFLYYLNKNCFTDAFSIYELNQPPLSLLPFCRCKC